MTCKYDELQLLHEIEDAMEHWGVWANVNPFNYECNGISFNGKVLVNLDTGGIYTYQGKFVKTGHKDVWNGDDMYYDSHTMNVKDLQKVGQLELEKRYQKSQLESLACYILSELIDLNLI